MPNQHTPLIMKLPEWFKLAANNALFDSKELTEIFGYSTSSCVIQAVNRGILPQADRVNIYRQRGINNKRYLWKKTTIVLEIERRKKLSAQPKSD